MRHKITVRGMPTFFNSRPRLGKGLMQKLRQPGVMKNAVFKVSELRDGGQKGGPVIQR